MMNINPKEDIKPLSAFRANPNTIIKQIKKNHRPVVITDRGNPRAVLVDLDEYESQREQMELMQAIIEGERDVEQKKLKSLNAVFKQSRRWFKNV